MKKPDKIEAKKLAAKIEKNAGGLRVDPEWLTPRDEENNPLRKKDGGVNHDKK